MAQRIMFLVRFLVYSTHLRPGGSWPARIWQILDLGRHFKYLPNFTSSLICLPIHFHFVFVLSSFLFEY